MPKFAVQPIQEYLVLINTGSVHLEGSLVIPEEARGVVVFAHGSGSSRHSPRNRYVATVLQQEGLATLLLDLLTPEEEDIDRRTRHLRSDIPLLASRLVDASHWLRHTRVAQHLKLGYFGASTGSAAALVAAAQCPETVRAIVSRGGRPDLATAELGQVMAPTLLLVGEEDFPCIGMNEDALECLEQVPEKRLEVIPHASHLFEETGTLEQVAMLASQWFKRYLTGPEPSRPNSRAQSCGIASYKPFRVIEPRFLAIPELLQRYGMGDRDFRGVTLSGSDLTGACLSGADFSRADLTGVNLSHAVLSNVNFSETQLVGANLSHANLFGAFLTGADGNQANFYGANLTESDLSGASLMGADLSDTLLHLTCLSEANLQGANLSGSRMCGARLWRANLCNVNLTGADLCDANLCEVNLCGATLEATDTSEAALTGAILSPQDLS